MMRLRKAGKMSAAAASDILSDAPAGAPGTMQVSGLTVSGKATAALLGRCGIPRCTFCPAEEERPGADGEKGQASAAMTAAWREDPLLRVLLPPFLSSFPAEIVVFFCDEPDWTGQIALTAAGAGRRGAVFCRIESGYMMTHYGNDLFSEIIHISDGAFPIWEDAEELRPASAAALLLYAAGKGDLLQSADAVRRAERAIRREKEAGGRNDKN